MFLEREMFQTKLVEKIKTDTLRSIIFLTCILRDMCKNMVQQGRPQMTIWRVRIVCWVTKAADTHSEQGIPIAFPLQQWVNECASV
jgi:hypothetical protein